MNTCITIDDGSPQDWKIAEMLRERGMVGTFFWSRNNPKHEVMPHSDMVAFAQKYPEHEIGQHTLNHRLLTEITVPEMEYEIMEGINWHVDMFGKGPRVFSYPRGYYTKSIMDFVAHFYDAARVVKSHNLGNILYEIPVGKHIPGREFSNSNIIMVHGWELEEHQAWGEFENMLNSIDKTVTFSQYARTYPM